jgi:ribonuclease HII
MFDLNYFQKYSTEKNIFIAGCDEVGRGPLAGPVVASCVLFHQEKYNEKELHELLDLLQILGVSDSKKITNLKREEIIEDLALELVSDQVLSCEISKNTKLKISIQEISADFIDEINILNASLLAMKKAFERNNQKESVGIILIDGNKKFNLESTTNIEIEAIVKGDTKSLLIGLASIVAKVYRDRLMCLYSEKYPGYFWERNAGYGTNLHLQAIKEIGVTPLHRKSFKGVKEVYEKRDLE